jgi:hypothetical protein
VEIGPVFHLTPLVDDLDLAIQRLEIVFAPHVYYRGYEAHINNRDAALMVVGDFVIEPMHPRAPVEGPANPTRRYLERFGEGIHSLAVYAKGLDEMQARFKATGVRQTDGGMPGALFTHPKDFPGLIEFFDPDLVPQKPDIDPRLQPGWSAAYWRDTHLLGMQFASHVTLLVHDHPAAAARYVEVLDVDVLPDQPASLPDSTSSYVTFGPDFMIELAQPGNPASAPGRQLDTIGQSWWGTTFVVRDLQAAAEFLTSAHIDVPVSIDDGTIRIDRAWMFGTEYAFTDTPLRGDPRGGR